MGEGNGSSNTAIVVVFLIVVIAAGVLFFLYQKGYFGGESKKVDIKIEAPQVNP